MGIKQIFKQGMQEFKRRSALGKVKRDLKSKEKLHSDRLTALGKKAWDSRLDIERYNDLKQSIDESQTQIDELKTRQAELEKKQADLDKKLQKENAGFESRRKEVEDKKKHVDSRLSDERKVLKAAQKDQDHAKSRIKHIEKEKDQLTKKSADPATSDPERVEIRQKLAGFETEKPQLEQKIKTADGTIRRQQQVVAPIEAEAAQFQKEIDHIKSEQKKEIGALEKQLAGIKSTLGDCTNTLDKTTNQQNGHFKNLGQKLSKDGVNDSAITPELSEVQNTEKEISDVRVQIDKLEQQGTSASRTAFWKMIGVIVGFIAAIILLIIIWNALFGSKPQTPEERAREFVRENIPGVTITGDQAKLPGGTGGTTSTVKKQGRDTEVKIPSTTKQIEDATEEMKKRSEQLQGGKITVSAKDNLVAALPAIGTWKMDEPRYHKSMLGNIEYSILTTKYTGPDGKIIDVTLTDAGTASAMLHSYQAIFQGNMSHEDDNGYQKIGNYNGIPVIESLDKRTQKTDFAFIIRGRYLIKLRSKGENSLSLLKYFMAKFNSSKLQ